MHISRVHIENFRNFKILDVCLGEHAVIIGENKIGKSNFLHAIRLILDPSMPDSLRKLREEDFWDGIQRPLDKDDRIVISVDLAEFENDENLLATLAEHIIQPEPMVARFTYIWQPIPGKRNPEKESDYEFLVYGADRIENRVGYEVRRRLPLELIPALRDCESDLTRWTRSPLRPLLEKTAGLIGRDTLQELSDGVDEATEAISSVEAIKGTAGSINAKLKSMVGSAQMLATALRFASTDADKMIRSLRLFIDGGKRGISDASLGSANLLFFALKSLEYEQLVTDRDRDHTFLAIEEPEAHLHPNLQRLIFRSYLRPRGENAGEKKPSTILMTTHSPHIVSVTPLKHFVVLRVNDDGDATEAVSTANTDLSAEDIEDLERYIDVTRGEILFARGVILVEGDAEKFLIPVLAKNLGFDLDELGISVCSVSGTNFAPYLKLLGPNSLNLPFAALTDFDPRKPKENGDERSPLGPTRIVNQMAQHVMPFETWDQMEFEAVLGKAEGLGLFLNAHTFEVDLFKSGLANHFSTAMKQLGSDSMSVRMNRWAENPATLDVDRFLSDIEEIGKGRYAQRLAGIIASVAAPECPEYISAGIRYVVEKTRRP